MIRVYSLLILEWFSLKITLLGKLNLTFQKLQHLKNALGQVANIMILRMLDIPQDIIHSLKCLVILVLAITSKNKLYYMLGSLLQRLFKYQKINYGFQYIIKIRNHLKFGMKLLDLIKIKYP